MKLLRRFKYALILAGIFIAVGCGGSRVTDTQQPPEQPPEVDTAFLDQVQHDTFNFFWETTNSENGLTPDRYPHTKFSSVAAVGFALTSYLVGVKDGYITRDQAARRTLTTLRFLWKAPQNDSATQVTGYKGFFYHFLDMQTGYRYRNVELSTIDTALLMAGVLSSQTYFDESTPTEENIRAYADSLYRRVDWQWAESKEHAPLVSMGWRPENGFISSYWRGYNEAKILYILALGSPSHPLPEKAWDDWTSTYNWDTFYSYSHVNFGPLFGHQYSEVWVDFRGIQDDYMQAKGIDYFINSKRATYANRAYCIDNPQGWRGYNNLVWGLTASDGPNDTTVTRNDTTVRFHSYWARGAASGYINDDGTIVPTAAGGSIAFAPDIAIPTLSYFYHQLGDELYGEYGYKDAFNLSYRYGSGNKNGWYDTDYLGIDQGPILLMIENYQTEFIWKLMQKNKYIRTGLERAGFKGGWLSQQ